MAINIRLILFLLGYFVCFTGILMLIPATIDWLSGYKEVSFVFLFLALLILFIGAIFILSNYQSGAMNLTIKDGLVLAFLSWIMVVLLAALPLHLSYLHLSYTDSFFEMMSAITTTGASVIPNLDDLSYGLHIWRALWQWIGGIGIIIIAVIVIPFMQGGGMNMFKVESFETFDSAFDKAKTIAKGMFFIYVIVTIATIFALLFVAKLNLLDSVVHALTSVSTAGFSTHSDSIKYFNNPQMEIILSVAMFIGGLPYILLYYGIFLRKPYILVDEQVKLYLILVIVSSLILVLWLYLDNGILVMTGLRYSIFTIISLLTGTGFVSIDYSLWGPFPTMFLFAIMFIGGCGGSTACGIKIYRFQIAQRVANTLFVNMLFKKQVNIPSYNGKAISQSIISQVFVFFYAFFILLFLFAIILSAMGLDFVTALSASATCLTNVGPGLGELIGPSTAGSFAALPNNAKWLLSIMMLVGRLEIIGVIVIFTKSFWKK